VSGAIVLLLIPATIIGVSALALAAAETSADGFAASSGRFFVMVASYLLYFIAFLAASLAASAFFKTARTALLVLFAFWIFNGLLVPRVVADAGQKIFPAPSYNEFWDNVKKDMSEGIDGHDPQNKRTEAAKKQLLAQYNVERVEDFPINFSGWSLQQGEEYGNQVFDRRYGEMWTIYERQNRVHEFGSLLAPLLAVRSVSMSMAGTDLAHHQNFATEAESYRRVINKMLNEDYMNNSRTGNTAYVANQTLWNRVPVFQYELPPTVWAVRTQILPLVMLLLWTLGAIGLAWLAINRMKVE